jgi:crotonobetainyl-CoA:carnitine CoA-transferase CaiB-like acyl-CoA transferase
MDEVDDLVADWVCRRDLDDVLAQFERAEAAIGPAYDIAQIFEDPQYQARGDIVDMEDKDLGRIKMTNAFPYLSETPAQLRHGGGRLGRHNEEILCGELGLDADALAELRDKGVI